jgi:hypothetical protein
MAVIAVHQVQWFDWGRVLRRFREFLVWRHFSLTSMKNIHTWNMKNLCSLTDVTENLYELKWEIARQSKNYNVLYHVHVDCTVQKCIWNTLLTCSELEIHHIILGQKVTCMWLGFIEWYLLCSTIFPGGKRDKAKCALNSVYSVAEPENYLVEFQNCVPLKS